MTQRTVLKPQRTTIIHRALGITNSSEMSSIYKRLCIDDMEVLHYIMYNKLDHLMDFLSMEVMDPVDTKTQLCFKTQN